MQQQAAPVSYPDVDITVSRGLASSSLLLSRFHFHLQFFFQFQFLSNILWIWTDSVWFYGFSSLTADALIVLRVLTVTQHVSDWLLQPVALKQ